MRADAGLAAFGGPLRPIVDDTSWVTRYDGLIASTTNHQLFCICRTAQAEKHP